MQYIIDIDKLTSLEKLQKKKKRTFYERTSKIHFHWRIIESVCRISNEETKS